MATAIKSIMADVEPQTLPKGSHDVTPREAKCNYTLEVTGYDVEEATGILQVSDPDNPLLIEVNSNNARSATRNISNGLIGLDHNNVQIIAEEATEEPNPTLNMYGVLIHRFKGVPAYPERK